MAFENFPYTDLHTLNMDWIMRKIKELEARIGNDDPEEHPGLEEQIDNILKILGDSGPGLVRMALHSEAGMTLVSPAIWRTKNDSSLFMSVNFKNSTGADIAADEHLLSFDNITIDTAEVDPLAPRTVKLWGIMCTFYHDDGTVTSYEPYLKYVPADLKSYFCIDHAIPQNCRVVVFGKAPLSVTKCDFILRRKHPTRLADDICYAFLHGVPGNEWQEGDFTYSNSASTRTDENARATDCSGMVYIAYHLYNLRPGRAPTATSYFQDGMVLSHAEPDEPLDLTNALPGDLICCHMRNEPNRIQHCMLYAGDNVVYEMSSQYTQAELDAGAIQGRGPYRIKTPANVYKMERYGRSLVRYL